jgi:hypothetical protein
MARAMDRIIGIQMDENEIVSAKIILVKNYFIIIDNVPRI